MSPRHSAGDKGSIGIRPNAISGPGNVLIVPLNIHGLSCGPAPRRRRATQQRKNICMFFLSFIATALSNPFLNARPTSNDGIVSPNHKKIIIYQMPLMNFYSKLILTLFILFYFIILNYINFIFI